MLKIEPLTTDDIAAAMQLVEAAGWNQVPTDWQRVIEYQPWGCFKAIFDDRLVGTVTSTSYGQELAWIGMMLVDPNMRRQGIGRSLMEQVINVLRSAGMQTIKLDATPVGRPLYEQLGFVPQFDFHRWRREEQPSRATLKQSSVPLAQYAELDLEAFGVDRQRLLTKLASVSCLITQETGYGMLRQGRIADYLGPVVDTCKQTAQEIISQLATSSTSSMFWDIPREDEDLIGFAREFGFEPVRVLTRMVLGKDSTSPNLNLQYAICDPGTG